MWPSTAQGTVAAEIAQQANDSRQLVPMFPQVKANLGRKPDAVRAGAGYWSEANATRDAVKGIDLLIATSRIQPSENSATESGPPPESATPRRLMQHKLRTESGRAVYRRRKVIIGPLFGLPNCHRRPASPISSWRSGIRKPRRLFKSLA
jgi:hypothetical protein